MSCGKIFTLNNFIRDDDMKMMKCLIALMAVGILNVAVADNQLPARQIRLPFFGAQIASPIHSGIYFKYDMNSSPAKKVVCHLDNIYKSWLEYTEANVLKESGLFGGNQRVIFTSKGVTENSGEDLSIYHADTVGTIRINDLRTNGFATCYYEVDGA